MSSRDRGPHTSTWTLSSLEISGTNRSRPVVLQARRCANSISWVPGEVLAQKLRAIGLEVPAPLLRPAHLRQLESHDRQKSALCLPTARTQRHDHVARLCGVDGGCTGNRHRADPGGDEQRRTSY